MSLSVYINGVYVVFLKAVRVVTIATATVFTIATAGFALDKLDVDLGFFPKGTQCVVNGTSGDVKMRQKRKEMGYKLKGDTMNVPFDCTLPDGRKISIDTGGYVRQDTDFTTMQLNANNKGSVMWKANGSIVQQKVSDFIKART